MTYIKLADKQFPMTIQTRLNDSMWDGRESKAITFEATYEEAMSMFVNDLMWSVLTETEEGVIETDMSIYALAGPVTDNRDGTVTVKMGKYKENELMQIPLGDTPKTHGEAVTLRSAIEIAVGSLEDKIASTVAMLFPNFIPDGSLVPAGTRINWNGIVKKAAVDLWATEDNDPDHAPTLWADLDYRDGYRIIPETITVTTAFAKDECGWWDGVLYRSLVDANVYTPSAYPDNWEVV